MRSAMVMMRSLDACKTIGKKVILLFGDRAQDLLREWRAPASELKVATALVEPPFTPEDMLSRNFEAIVTHSRKWWDWIKLYTFLLPQFDKVILLDSDLLFLSNVDELFAKHGVDSAAREAHASAARAALSQLRLAVRDVGSTNRNEAGEPMTSQCLCLSTLHAMTI